MMENAVSKMTSLLDDTMAATGKRTGTSEAAVIIPV